jgi:hypothetical protein
LARNFMQVFRLQSCEVRIRYILLRPVFDTAFCAFNIDS